MSKEQKDKQSEKLETLKNKVDNQSIKQSIEEKQKYHNKPICK